LLVNHEKPSYALFWCAAGSCVMKGQHSSMISMTTKNAMIKVVPAECNT
jgi:hypothetical protein